MIGAPRIVPKTTLAMNRLKMKYRPIVTVTTAWLKRHIDSWLAQVCYYTVFEAIDFSMDTGNSRSTKIASLCMLFIRMMVWRSRNGLHKGVRQRPNFHSSVEPCFVTIRGNHLAWIDDFMFHIPGENIV